MFVLYTIGIGAGAINTGNNLLYLIFGIFLGVILASGVLSDLSLWKVSVEPIFPDHIEDGQANMIPFRIRNGKKKIPSLSLTVEVRGTLRGKPASMKRYVPVVFGGEDRMSHFIYIPSQRGRFEAEFVRLSTRFPFGLLLKWWSLPVSEPSPTVLFQPKVRMTQTSMFVYPRPVDVDRSKSAIQTVGDETTSALQKKGDGATLDSIRDYRETDNPRRIHWKASAKRFALDAETSLRWLVREMETEANEEITIRWPDLDRFSVFGPSTTEDLIRFSASLARELWKRGHGVRLVVPMSGGGAPQYWEVDPARGWEGIMEFHAIVEGSQMDSRTAAYLKPVRRPVQAGHSLEVNLLHVFQAWRAKTRKAA